MPKKVITPRPYLSYQQYRLFRANPAEYRRQYILGQKHFKNSAMGLGSRLHEIFDGDSDDPVEQIIKLCRPPYRKTEHELRVKVGRVPVFSILDGYGPGIGEYKTGGKKAPNMLAAKKQLKFYALLVWIKTKKIPTLTAYWFETKNGQLTGHYETVKVKVTKKELMILAADVQSVWLSIQRMSAEEYKLKI